MRPKYKEETQRRLKVTSGHLHGVRRMVEEDAYCVDLMKRLSAVQVSSERAQQTLLRGHLLTCVSKAAQSDGGEEISDELLGALKYDKRLTDGRAGASVEVPAETFAEES